MLVSDDDIGLATYEYPGMYTVHWFFVSRGRKAINLAKDMFDYMFKHHEAKALRGLTPEDKKAARWASRQTGMKSYGLVPNEKGKLHELFIITKEDFYKERETN
jgi:hypothetical protein